MPRRILSPLLRALLVMLPNTNCGMAFSPIDPSSICCRAGEPYRSPCSLRSRPQNQVHSLSASVDAHFCAEGFITEVDDHKNGEQLKLDVHINRIEQGDKRLGYDVTSAREWMEHIEERDGPLRGAGAYTVLRCDAVYNQDRCRWKLWGLDFHMSRLCSSYKMLLKRLDGDPKRLNLAESVQESDDVITSLLDEAKTVMQLGEVGASLDEDFGRTLMLTILWSPPEIEGAKPIVRGHAAFAGVASAQTNKAEMPSAISACLAIPGDATPNALALLPRRHSDDDSQKMQLVGASAKISSWCRTRRPLETQFKTPGSGVGEVLLVRKDQSQLNIDQQDFIDSLEILEGLTSNLFIVYNNGTLRTAPVGVLSGYARHLVVETMSGVQSANSPTTTNLGNLVLDDTKAPSIKDAADWSEVFVTSAIRLVVPVHRVVIPPVGDQESGTLWQSNDDEGYSHPVTHSIWSAVHERGYNLASSRG